MLLPMRFPRLNNSEFLGGVILGELMRCFLIFFLVVKFFWQMGQGTTRDRSCSPLTCLFKSLLLQNTLSQYFK